MEENKFKIGDYVRIIDINAQHDTYGGKKILNKKGKIIRSWVGNIFKWYIELDSGHRIGALDEHLELIRIKGLYKEDVKLKKTNKDLLGL